MGTEKAFTASARKSLSDGDPARPTVAIIGTGGSIATVGRGRLDLFEYGDFGHIIDVDELLKQVPEAFEAAQIVGINFSQVISREVGPVTWLALVRLIDRIAHESPQVSGIVLTHGTATLEETAYFLDLALKLDISVVVTGAQRSLVALGTDGPLNLLNAIRIAASPLSRSLGVLVTMNGEIHSARDVTKSSTRSLDAFKSLNLGPLGSAELDGSIVLYRRPMRKHAPDTPFDVSGMESLPRVDIVYSYGGVDATAIRAAVDAGAVGLVSAGFAPGRVSVTEWNELLKARERGVVVVQSSRSAGGRVLSRTVFRQHGIVAADDLNPAKARILTMLALTVTKDPDRIQEFFYTY